LSFQGDKLNVSTLQPHPTNFLQLLFPHKTI